MGNVLGHFFTGTAIACLLKLTTSVDDLIWCVHCGLVSVSSDARARLAIEYTYIDMGLCAIQSVT
jgi:hypothetical protein